MLIFLVGAFIILCVVLIIIVLCFFGVLLDCA